MENVNFSTFCSSFFYSVERRFFVLEYRKGHFPMLYCGKKKKLEKGPFLDQNHGLIRLEKCHFFNFLNLSFLEPKKVFFFVLEYRKRHFPGLYCLKTKVEKMAIF